MASVLILFNPISGGGRAGHAAGRLDGELRAAGHDSITVPTRREPGHEWLVERLGNESVLVVVGGDGAVRATAEAAIRTRTPLYHVPYGTANLFAGEFGMDRRAGTLLRALDRLEVHWVDVGDADGELFVLMASVGFDAEVVHDLAAHRGGRISYLSYAGPMLRQLRDWKPVGLAISVDGLDLPLAGPGIVVVANARRYAFGLDPAPGADMTDGLLDVVYLPTASRRQVLLWMAKLRLGRHEADPAVIMQRGVDVRIECDQPQRLQLDGDPASEGNPRAGFRLVVRPGVLPVLVPAISQVTSGRFR